MGKFKDADPNIIKKMYDYHVVKRDEEMVMVAHATEKYKKEVSDPSRTIATIEKVGNMIARRKLKNKL